MPEPKTSPRRIEVAERRAKALELRKAGVPYDKIKDQLGYKTRAAAIQDVQRAMAAMVREPADDLRALEDERLDMLWFRAMQVLSRQHITVSNGRVVMHNGQPVTDDGPILAAIRELRMLSESRRKLHGWDAPTKVEVITDDALDREIKRLSDELGRAAAGQAAGAATPEGEVG